ncbi:MAG: hypothetical protein L6Q77_02140 [Bacteroidetes bacterium]|nr:hypothetical protein [Bacteroidota bacterium]
MANNNWIVDADSFDIKKNNDLILYTDNIIEFLNNENTDDSFIVATKGIGKTLLLKMKRDSLNSYIVIPQSGIDNFVTQSTLSKEAIDLFKDKNNMETLWTISIIIAIMKKSEYNLGNEDISPFILKIYNNKLITHVSEIFISIIHANRSEYFRSKEDLEKILIPIYRKNISGSFAIFIDNIDEYFKKHLDKNSKESRFGEIDPEIWYSSQIGLMLSYFNLRKLNHHIKLYASIRQEAFNSFQGNEELFQQINGKVFKLNYSKSDLANIFINNLKKEKKSNYCDPINYKNNIVRSFFGFEKIYHKHLKKHEPIVDYILRHTLGRPRDLMQIGKALVQLTTREREPNIIRQLVHNESKSILDHYLSMVNSHIPRLDLKIIFQFIETNALKYDDLKAICGIYNDQTNFECNRITCSMCKKTHIFCILHKIGLLGTIYNDGMPTKRIQKFITPGEKTFSEDHFLPNSEIYIIHPVLNASIKVENSKYMTGRNQYNIVGNDLEWVFGKNINKTKKTKKVGVLVGDIKDYGKTMTKLSGKKFMKYQSIVRKIINIENLKCDNIGIKDGDKVVIYEKNSVKLITAAFRIIDELKINNIFIRIGIDFGNVEFYDDDIKNGIPILQAARLEPIVTPSQVWCTEKFKTELEKITNAYNYEDVSNEPSDSFKQKIQDGKVIVNKESQDTIKLKVFRIKRE